MKANPLDAAYLINQIKSNLDTSLNPKTPARSADWVLYKNMNLNYALCMLDFWQQRAPSFSPSAQQIYKTEVQENYASASRRKAEERTAVERRNKAEALEFEERKQAIAAKETLQFREDIEKLNAGQLFVKADELSAQGDKAKARETLRLLVSKFPDHPLAATAAQQMATMNAASANNANATNTSGSGGTSGNGGVSNVSAQSGGAGKCWDVLARKEKEYEAINRRPLPQGATPGLMRVMWVTEDSIKVIDANCAGDAKAAKYRSELETTYNQAKTACGQLTAGGQCKANAF